MITPILENRLTLRGRVPVSMWCKGTGSVWLWVIKCVKSRAMRPAMCALGTGTRTIVQYVYCRDKQLLMLGTFPDLCDY
jgi:hypothetical protein